MSSSQAITVTPLTVAGGVDSSRLEDSPEAFRQTTPSKGLTPLQLVPPSILAERTKDSSLLGAYSIDTLQPQSTSLFTLELKREASQAAPGYAQAETKGSSGSEATSKTKGDGEWDFLNDPNMSIEDKLFMFMKLAQKNMNEQLDKKMEEYRKKYTDDGGGGGGLFGFLGDLFSGDFLKDLVEKVGGFLMKAGGSALGFTPLGLVTQAVSALGSGGFANAGASTAEKGEAGSPDEKLDMLELQRMVEKQQQLFNCIANILKTVHETGMTAIDNIR